MADGLTLLLGVTTVASGMAWINARARAIYYEGRYRALLAHETLDPYPVEPSHLLCGACGLSVPTTDGFTIAEHNCCQPELFSSTGVAQREM